MTAYTVKHLDLHGTTIDRETAYPDVEFELQPIGTQTTKPTDRLQVKIMDGTMLAGNVTVLGSREAAELRDWLVEHLRT